MRRYEGFHQHPVLADKNPVEFYESFGLERAICPAMWIYKATIIEEPKMTPAPINLSHKLSLFAEQ